MKVILIIVLAFFVGSCNKKSTLSKSDTGCVDNTSRTYSLCIESTSSEKDLSSTVLKFRLLSSSGEEVYKGSIDNGTVEWLDDDAIAMIQIPGNVSTELIDEDYTRVFVISKSTVVSKKDYIKEN